MALILMKFFLEPGEGRVDCHPKTSEEYIEQVKKKLAKKGYTGPTVVSDDSEETEGDSQCSVEQIAAMVKAGLTEEQIKAVCSAK